MDNAGGSSPAGPTLPGMGWFSVDPDAMHALAGTLGELSGQVQAASTATTDVAVGVDPAVASALAGFEAAWRPGLAVLGTDLRRLADAVALAARCYQDVEIGASSSLLARLS